MSSGQPHDHFISRAHIRQWATDNRVTVLRRGQREPKLLDVGKAVAAEQGLNDPVIEAAYGRVESAFSRALSRSIRSPGQLTGHDRKAFREYCVLMHDRYPALRGSSIDHRALPGGGTMMVPDPANWGVGGDLAHSLAQLAPAMPREEPKLARLQLLPTFAHFLPDGMWIFRGGPMLLGDAGLHSMTLHPQTRGGQTYVAMPLAPDAMLVLGKRLPPVEDVETIGRTLTMRVAMSSTVVVDTPAAPVITAFVQEMWGAQLGPAGTGTPAAMRIWDQPEDIPNV